MFLFWMHTEEVHVTSKRSTGRTDAKLARSDAEEIQQTSDILMNETTAVGIPNVYIYIYIYIYIFHQPFGQQVVRIKFQAFYFSA